jgi:hypothetical protein
MAKTATITIALPPTYDDGTTPFTAADYGGAHVFQNGVQIGSITAPALTFTTGAR